MRYLLIALFIFSLYAQEEDPEVTYRKIIKESKLRYGIGEKKHDRIVDFSIINRENIQFPTFTTKIEKENLKLYFKKEKMSDRGYDDTDMMSAGWQYIYITDLTHQGIKIA